MMFALFLTVVGAPAGAETPTPKAGSFSFSGSASEIAKMKSTVDEIVADLNMFLRPIARPRLRSECAHWDRVVIRMDDGEISVAIDGEVRKSPLGKKVQVKDDLTLLRTMRGDVLVEKYVGEKGGRSNEYHPTPTGIRVKSQIWAPQLPRPVHFEYTYN